MASSHVHGCFVRKAAEPGKVFLGSSSAGGSAAAAGRVCWIFAARTAELVRLVLVKRGSAYCAAGFPAAWTDPPGGS